MESSEYSNYVNLPSFYGEMDDNIMKSNEIDSISMSQYINDSSRHEVESIGNLGVNSFDNGNQYTSDTTEGWDSSAHMIHNPIQNAQNNNAQLALINPVAAGSQYLTDSTFMEPGQSLKVQGHSYGTRYANQLRPTPGIEPRRRKIQKEKNEPEDKGPYCVCQGPSYGTMIICDFCNEWYHIRCVNLTKQQAKEIEKYMCPNCQGTRTLTSLIQDDCPTVETTGIDPKALMIEEPKQIEPSSPPKCKLQGCTEKARDNNPYCSNKCFIQGHILEIKKSQDTVLVQNQSESTVAESKKTPRPILPRLKSSPVVKKSSSTSTKSGSTSNKVTTTKSGDNRPKIRDVFPEKLKGLFASKYTELIQEPDFPEKDKIPHELGLQLANEIEEAIFNKFAKGIIGQDYKTKVRSLITSLNDPKNANLLRRILLGDIPPETLVMMSSEELANPEQKALMAKVRRESLQRSILKREDTGPRIKTTHKGELIIVENVRDSPRDSPKDTSAYSEEDNSPTYATFTPVTERPKFKFEDLISKKLVNTDGSNETTSKNLENNSLAGDISTNMDMTKETGDKNDDNNEIIQNSDDTRPELVFDDKEMVYSPSASKGASPINSPSMHSPPMHSPLMHSPPNLSYQYSPGSPSNGFSPKSPPNEITSTTPEIVWTGKLVFDKKIGDFSGHADLLAAKKRDKKRNWDEYLASSIIVNGHVSRIEDVDNYLVDCWCSPNKDIAIIRFEIGENSPNNKEFETIFNSLHYAPKTSEEKKRRYGRVAPAYNTVRDMYIISLEPEDKLPDVVTFLDLDGILSLEKRPNRLLLGAIIIVEAESNKAKRIHEINEINGRATKKEKGDSEPTTNLAKVIALPNIGSNLVNNESIQSNVVPTTSSIGSSDLWLNQQNSVNGTAGASVPSTTISAFLQSSLAAANQNSQNLNSNISQGVQQAPHAQQPQMIASTNGLYGIPSYPPNPPIMHPPQLHMTSQPSQLYWNTQQPQQSQVPPQNYPVAPPPHQQWVPPMQPQQHPQQQVFPPQQGPPLGQPPFMPPPPPSHVQQPNVPTQYGHHVISDPSSGASQQQPIRQQMSIGTSQYDQYNTYPPNYSNPQYESPRPQLREKPHWNRDNRSSSERDRNRHARPRRFMREDRRHHDSEDYRPPPRDPRRPSPPSSDYRDFKRGGRSGRYR